MSIEDPRLSSIDNTSAADEFDSAVEQHLGFASETVEGIEVAQAETPDAGRTDRLPAQQPVDVAAAVIPSEVTPDNENVVTLPAGIELDNLEFQVDGENLVLVLADGTEITVIGGAANIPTFVVGDVELPQVALFAALEESNINVAAGPDGTFSAQSTPAASRNFNDDPIDAGPEDLALADLLGDTSFGDELRTAAVFGGNGRPSIPTPLTTSFIYDEAVIAGGDGVKIISGRLPFNPGPDSGTITAIGFVGASDVNEGDGLKVLGGFTSGGLPITVTSFPAPTDAADLDFLALEGRDSAGNLVFTITITNRVEGDFTFELFGKLEHPDAGSNGSQDDLDDLLRLGFTYTVTDQDGDSVTGTFNIDVQDDAPTIGAPVGGSVNEDDLTSKVVEPKLVKRVSDSESDSDMPLSSTSKAEGSLGIRWGADNDLKSETLGEGGELNGDDPVGRTVSFTGLDTSSTSEEIQAAIPGLAGLSSDGSRLAYRIEYTTGADGKWNGGYQLVAYKPFFDGPLKALYIEGEGDKFVEFPYPGEGETIFIITLNPTTANGSYTFELVGNLDHYEPVVRVDEPTDGDTVIELPPVDGPELQVAIFDGDEGPKLNPVDFLDFEIPFTATDSDGDSADGKFTVRVEDDEPVIIGRPIAHTVDEDDISTIGRDIPGESLGTSPNDGNRDGSFTGDRGSNNPGPATVSGSLAGMVDFGADNRFTTYSIIDEDAARAVLTRLGLTSKGGELSFDLIGDTLYAFVNAGEPGVVYNAGPDRLVFTLTVEANGEYAFKLFDQLDHDLGKGQNTDLQDDVEGDVRDIDFGQIIKASDFDGDSVPLTGYFSVTIRDDVPELVRGASEHRTVDEDDISTLGNRFPGESLGTSPNDGNADGSFTGSQGNNQPGPAFLSGSLASLVKSGADESLTFSFINGDVARGMLESLGLSSKGAELSYEIRNGVLYAFDNAGPELGKSYDPQFGDRLVFELKLNGNGSYEFRLYDQLDHDAPGDDFRERPTNSDENFDLQDGLWFKDVTAINFGALIKATDYDGDSVSLNNAFSIKIRDDVPELSGREENRLVDEDDIRTSRSVGTSPNDGNGDGSYTGSPNNNQPGPAFISGSLANLIKGGADDTVKFSFIREQTAVSELQFLGLSSKGVKLSYDIQGKTLYAYDNDAGDAGYGQGDRLVFKLTVNEDGSYTFELHDQLDHDLGKGQNTDLQDGFRYKDVEAIDFGSIIKATDFDGDSVILKDAFSITIKDDVPELSGAKEERLVDEDDIKTSRSVGTSPNDGNSDGSFTGSPNNNQPGPAFISGSLANLIKGGADDTVNFTFISEQTAVSELRYLGLSSKGAELSYDIQGNTLYAYDNDAGNSGYGEGDRLVFKLTVNEDGSYTFELHDQLDHDLGKGQNTDLQDGFRYKDVEAIDFGSIIKATDHDGDSVILKDAFTITIKDDVPTAVARNTNETLVVDESDKRQNEDVDGPLNVFRFVGTKGEDPNMSAQFAQQSNFVAADINGGADDDVKIEWDLKINGGDRTPSGLFTTDGRSIVLFLENGLIVGRYDGPDGNSTVNSSDPAAFALHLSDNGTLSLVQYVSIRHDDPSDHDENDDANDRNPSTALQTLAGKVNAVLTVTDFDGDKAVSEVAVGSRIQFEDDGPSVKPYDVNTMRIISDDDTVAGRNGNPGFGSNTADGSGSDSKEYNKTGTLQFSAGADGGTVAWDLTKVSVDSGATGITFSVNSSGTLLIFQNQGGSAPVQIAQVTLNAVTGAYVYTQTANLLHTTGGEENEAAFTLGFTVTDGDGDKADGKLALLIDDDTPTLVSTPTTGLSLNEDDLALGNDETTPKELLSATGNLNISLGADGGSIALSAPAAEWSATNKTLTAGDGSWKVTLNSDGTYKFDLLDNTLAHGFADNGENTFSVEVTYTATDGDQDVLTGSFKIEIVDDVPVAVGESATVRESAPSSVTNLILTFDVSGSMDREIGGGQSRLDIARAAAVNLINLSNAAQVLVVTFSENASNTVWMSKAAAITYINSGNFPDAEGGTDYDKVIDRIQGINLPASGNTSVYFFSDGDPNNGDDLSNSERLAWENYLQTNGIKSYAVGVGVSANDDDLEDVAYPGEPISITSPTDLILTGTVVLPVPTSASGNVLTNDSFGADGGRIQSILVDDVTHTWDGSEANEVLNVTTVLGGSLMFNFRTGAWEYNAPAQLVSNTPETFTYTLVDGDGDTITANLVVNVQAVNDAPENAVPSTLTAAEDIELSITNVSVSDVDAGNGDLTVKLEVKKGALTLASEDDLVVSNNGSGTVTLTGSLTAINAALLGMKYKGDLNFNGSDELKITTTDNGNTGLGGAKTDVDTVAITVTPVNDAPVLSPETREIEFTENGNGRYLFSNVNVSDVDNPANFAGGSIEISLGNTAVAGDQIFADSDVRLNGNNVQIWRSGWVTIGTLASGGFGQTSLKIDLTSGATEDRVEFFLASVAYKSTSDNPTDADRLVTVTFNDGGNSGAGGSLSDTSTITVKVNPVNDAPVAADDRVITNAGVGTQFEVPDWALLFNDTDVDSDDLSVTSISNRSGLNANTSADGVVVIDTGNSGGSFDYRAYDGEDRSGNARVTVMQRTSGPLDGTSGNDILVGVAKPVGQITTIKFANSYDVGDVVSVTLNGKTFSHTVVTGGTSVTAVYNALLAATPVGSVQTLQQLLASEGIDDARQGSTVTWSGEPGVDNRFEVSTEILNVPSMIRYTQKVDFPNEISKFNSGQQSQIQLVIAGETYTVSSPNGQSGHENRFDVAAINLAALINNDLSKPAGLVSIEYDTGSNDFTVTTSQPVTITASTTAKTVFWIWEVDATPSVGNPIQVTSSTAQPSPAVETIQDATDGGVTMNGLAGDDILIGSDADDVLNGGSGNDILFGGLGLDTMTGGAGADTFVFDEEALQDIGVTDVITDYNLAQGDMLDVSALLDSLLGEAAGDVAREEAISIRLQGGDTFVSVDTAGGPKDIVMLEGNHANVKILFDDNHATTVPHD
ncbi:MAG: VWA domain-containing protein [Alphaproteobacteria bacterium]|nr:VWA domain-containing protein [Alphaproteobacteria bacterium]MBU1763226.1 VWA domain-containing protein [Alphaproteobacteria bacterium]